jgi:hypothetical protein
MTALATVFTEVVGLFVDDGWLALSIIGVVALTALVAVLAPHAPIAAGVVLLGGCLGVLFVNVIRARRR